MIGLPSIEHKKCNTLTNSGFSRYVPVEGRATGMRRVNGLFEMSILSQKLPSLCEPKYEERGSRQKLFSSDKIPPKKIDVADDRSLSFPKIIYANLLDVPQSDCNSYGVYVNRTPAIKDAILRVSSVSSWDDMTPRILSDITGSLVIKERVETLKMHDFDGLLFLSGLDLSRVFLREIPLGALDPLVSLCHLNLSENSLNFLPDGLFKFQKKLSYLSFRFCFLKGVSSGFLNGLESLQHLDFSFNCLPSLPNDFFEKTPNLEFLDLSFNGIGSVNKMVFSTLCQLIHLDLSYNAIENIDEDAFSELVQLMQLKLHFNPLLKISNDLFQSLKNLRFLSLYGNILKTIDIHGSKRKKFLCVGFDFLKRLYECQPDGFKFIYSNSNSNRELVIKFGAYLLPFSSIRSLFAFGKLDQNLKYIQVSMPCMERPNDGWTLPLLALRSFIIQNGSPWCGLSDLAIKEDYLNRELIYDSWCRVFDLKDDLVEDRVLLLMFIANLEASQKQFDMARVLIRLAEMTAKHFSSVTSEMLIFEQLRNLKRTYKDL